MNPLSSRFRTGLFVLIAAWCVATSHRVHAQDYEREKRWADEVIPGLVVGDAVRIKGASNREFLALYTGPIKPNPALPAIVLVHGVGVHPDFGVIGILRAKLADIGYATLAVQMPVHGKEALAGFTLVKWWADASYFIPIGF